MKIEPTKPYCFLIRDKWSWLFPQCTQCAFYLCCAADADKFRAATAFTRKGFVALLARENVPSDDAIVAIIKVFGITRDAAQKQYKRHRLKMGEPR